MIYRELHTEIFVCKQITFYILAKNNSGFPLKARQQNPFKKNHNKSQLMARWLLCVQRGRIVWALSALGTR